MTFTGCDAQHFRGQQCSEGRLLGAFPVVLKGILAARCSGHFASRIPACPGAGCLDTTAKATYFPHMEISIAGNDARADDIGTVFAALADSTRRRIVEALLDRELTVGALASTLALGAPTVSKHLTVLERAGLISRQRDAQRRLCRLEPAGFTSLAAWSRRYEQLWASGLANLDDYLTALDGRLDAESDADGRDSAQHGATR